MRPAFAMITYREPTIPVEPASLACHNERGWRSVSKMTRCAEMAFIGPMRPRILPEIAAIQPISQLELGMESEDQSGKHAQRPVPGAGSAVKSSCMV
jgi:hypothetical protein